MRDQKKSKFFILILAIAITLPQWASAQHKGEARMEKMQTELNLSDQQVADLKAIHEEYRELKKTMRSSENPDQQRMQKMRQKKEAAILEVLNEEQVVLYKAKKEQQKGKMKKHSKEKKALKTELKAYNAQEVKPVLLQKRMEFDAKLSEDDKAEIAALRQAFKSLKKGSNGHGHKGAKGDRSQSLQKDKKPMAHRKTGGKKQGGLKKAMAENPELEQRTMALVNKYAKDLKKIEKKLAPLQEQWRTDKQNILAKHLDPAMMEKMEAKKAEKGKEKKSEFQKVHFLLMDPTK